MKKIITILILLLMVYSIPAKSSEITSKISKSAKNKLEHHLAISTIYYNEYKNSKREENDWNKMFSKLSSMSNTIEVEFRDKQIPLLDVIIKTDNSSKLIQNEFLLKPRIHKGDSYDYITAGVKLDELEQLTEDIHVINIEPSYILHDCLEQSALNINADSVWSGNIGIDDMITGEDVFVGIIDTKPRKDHVTFEDENGNCRFVDDFNNFNTTDPDDHGTHVAGIACGKGDLDAFRGIAYKSKILWKEGSTTDSIINGFQDMINYVGSEPLVVNLSQGFYLGPHDGKTNFEQVLDSFIEDNKMMVVSGGNANGDTFNNHYQNYVINEEVLTISVANLNLSNIINNEFEIEIWFDGNNDLEVRVKYGNTNYSNWVTPDNEDTHDFGDGVVDIYNNGTAASNLSPYNNNDNVIYLNFKNPGDGDVIETGTYTIQLKHHSPNQGNVKIDAYNSVNATINEDGEEVETQGNAFYGGDNDQTILSPGYAEDVITVAACSKNEYDNGNIASYSGNGPARDDIGDMVSKPDITAPGGAEIDTTTWEDWIYSAGSGSNNSFIPMKGTSMAAPHVTGSIALIMQYFPDLSFQDIKNIFKISAAGVPPYGHSYSQNNLTLEEKKNWGAGKLDILQAYKTLVGYCTDINDYPAFPIVFNNHAYLKGLPVEIVQWDWNGYAKQKLTYGAIVESDVCPDDAAWLGEEIWDKWIEIGHVNSDLGMPTCSEFIDPSNNDYKTVNFSGGSIYFNGTEAIVVIDNTNYFDLGTVNNYLPGNQTYGSGRPLVINNSTNDLLVVYRESSNYPYYDDKYTLINNGLTTATAPLDIVSGSNRSLWKCFHMENDYLYIAGNYTTGSSEPNQFVKYDMENDNMIFISEHSWFPTGAGSDNKIINLVKGENNFYLLNTWRYNGWNSSQEDLYMSVSTDGMQNWSDWINGGHTGGEGDIYGNSSMFYKDNNIYGCINTEWGGNPNIVFFKFDTTTNQFTDMIQVVDGEEGIMFFNDSTNKFAIAYLNSNGQPTVTYSNTSNINNWTTPVVIDENYSNGIYNTGNSEFYGIYDHGIYFYLWMSESQQVLFRWDGDDNWYDLGEVPKTHTADYFRSKVISDQNYDAIIYQNYINDDNEKFTHIKRVDLALSPPQISMTPDSLHFAVNIGNQQSQDITISNSGELPLDVELSSEVTVTDIDGNVYQTVQIGDQLWMAENLKVTHYRDGDPIPNVTNGYTWADFSSGAYCYYNNDSAHGDTYGALYNWYAMDDPRGLAPEGWHVPTDDEIKELEMYLGMSQSQANGTGYRGTNEGSKLAGGYDLWDNGDLRNDPEFDTSGFSFLPGGSRGNYSGAFSNMGYAGKFWSFTEHQINNAWYRNFNDDYAAVARYTLDKRHGFSVRCVRDNSDLTIRQFTPLNRPAVLSEANSTGFDNLDEQRQAAHLEKNERNGWLTYTPTVLSIEPGASEEVLVTVNAEGIPAGTYEDSITVSSNDPANPLIKLPVTMIVTEIGVDNQDEQLSEKLYYYPNPITTTTKKINVSFSLKKSSKVNIKLYNIKGQLVTEILNDNKPSGTHTITSNINNLASGIYFIKMDVDGKNRAVKKMVKIE